MQAVQDAESKVQLLTLSDIAEIKSIKNPSMSAKKVLEAACVLKGQKMMRFRDDDQWTMMMKIGAEPSFFESLKSFEKDQIPADTVSKVNTMFADPDMQASQVER